MKRDDAIACFGHHYKICLDDQTITEWLGSLDPVWATRTYETIEKARSALDSAVREQAVRSLTATGGGFDRISGWASSFSDLVFSLYTKTGLFPKAARRLETIKADKAMYRDYIENGLGGREKIQPLPDDIRIPHILPVGRTIYEVVTNDPFVGVRINCLQIKERTPYVRRYDGRHDYTVTYAAAGKFTERRLFEYPFNDEGMTELHVANGQQGERYFLTQEAADNAAMNSMLRLRERFTALARNIHDRAQKRHSPTQTPTSTPHMG